MPIPTHLPAANYPKAFPAALDSFPTVTNEEHYIDAWLINSAFSSLLAIETFLLSYAAFMDIPEGDDIIGADGEFDIPIPPGRYYSYKSVLAWDSNLLAENVKAGVNIFGVPGTLSPVGSGIAISNIQFGSVTIPTNATSGSTVITAAAPDASIAFPLGFTSGSSAQRYGLARLVFTDSTHISALRNTLDNATTVVMNFCVITFSSGVNLIQRGTIPIASAGSSGSTAITAVDLAKSVLFFLGYTTTYAGVLTLPSQPRLSFPDSSHVQADCNAASAAETIGYCVLEFE